MKYLFAIFSLALLGCNESDVETPTKADRQELSEVPFVSGNLWSKYRTLCEIRDLTDFAGTYTVDELYAQIEVVDGQDQVFTYATFTRQSSWSDNAPETLETRMPGGMVGDVSASSPVYLKRGEQVVLFNTIKAEADNAGFAGPWIDGVFHRNNHNFTNIGQISLTAAQIGDRDVLAQITAGSAAECPEAFSAPSAAEPTPAVNEEPHDVVPIEVVEGE